MMKRLLAASTIVTVSFVAPSGSFSPRVNVSAQAPAAQGATQTPEPGPARMQEMMKMHEQVMAEMKAADVKLDALVKTMNTATGEAKVNAVAAVVTELVQQHKAMSRHMGQMQEQMMGGRGMMMKK